MLFPLNPGVIFPGSFSVGRMRVPVYGLFAAAGLIAALALSQRTARRANLSPDRLWNAGMFAVIAAFVASRVLLVLTNLKAAIAFPFLMLTVPSLTYTGLLLTAILTFGFLRQQKISVLSALDAWAPCAAFLVAVLQLGHFFEGTEAGMPTTLPWGVRTMYDTVLGRVHPVQLYATFVALGLTEFLLIRLKYRKREGQILGDALLFGGLGSFLLDMLRQPTDSLSPLWLDASQFLAIAAMLAGIVLFAVLHDAQPQTKQELA